jgi:hypothetical protein
MQVEKVEAPKAAGGDDNDRKFVAAFALCSLAALCVLWIPKYLPLSDLPQHAAQISIWKHIDDPAYGFRDVFELQYFSPYLLGYGLARLFAELFSVLVALKLVLTLSVLGLPWSLWRLLEASRGDRWWSLVGFPLAFGYSFLWGFFSYIVALPLGVLYLAFVVESARSFSTRRAVLLAAFTTLLFGAHLIVFALCGLSAAALLALSAKSLRDALVRLWPLAVGAVVALTWMSRYQKGRASVPNVFDYGLGRLVEAPALLLGYPDDTPSLLVALLLMVLFLASGVKLAERRERWIPLGVWACAYMAVPRDYNNVAFLYPRLATLLVPFAIVATEQGRPRFPAHLTRGALTSIALVWMAFVFIGFAGFDSDARQFDVVMSKMEPNKRIRSLVFERGGEYTPGGVPFLHFPAWYQTEKGGTDNYSFAYTLLSVAVFRDKTKTVQASVDWQPWRFDMAEEQDEYDYYVVRAATDMGPELFKGATRHVHLAAHEGWWWVYRRGEPLP